MATIINMQDMRHLNLFEKITGIQTRHCFNYNDILMFCVPKKLIAKAIGKDNINLKKLSSILKRRIRMIALPKSEENIEEFIKAIVSPLEFKNLEVNDEEIILTAGAQSKAALLGRNKRRYQEMQKIIESFFRKSYKIV